MRTSLPDCSDSRKCGFWERIAVSGFWERIERIGFQLLLAASLPDWLSATFGSFFTGLLLPAEVRILRDSLPDCFSRILALLALASR